MGGHTVSSIISNDVDDQNRKNNVYQQVIKTYDDLKNRVDTMKFTRRKVLSYTPGLWAGDIGGVTRNVPKTTTLLLVGPKGSGKSSLVNRISRVFEDDKFAPERAQVTYNYASTLDGTRYLQEYMIPRNSTSFCLYDSPGFSDGLFENLEMINQWMTKGVLHGESLNRMNCDELLNYGRKRVDFVIFVVNGLSVLKCMENSAADTSYMYRVTEVFNSPFLSFKDHKPIIAITHGDLLSISERARVRAYLGDALGVHPSKQTFDIPDNCDPITELTAVDMVRYALEHADRNLPCKSQPPTSKVSTTIELWTQLLLVLGVAILLFTIPLHGSYSPKHNSESVPAEPNFDIKKVMELHQESVLKAHLEILKVTEVDQKSVPEPDVEIVKVAEYDQENVSEPDLGTKNVTETDAKIMKIVLWFFYFILCLLFVIVCVITWERIVDSSLKENY